MKQFITIITLLIFAVTADASRSLKLGLISYPLPPATRAQIDFVKANFDNLAGFQTPAVTLADVAGYAGQWNSYLESATLGTPHNVMLFTNYLRSKGVVTEDGFLHAKTDYTASFGRAWCGIDQFDVFEGAHGVMLESGGVYIEKTVNAYDVLSGCAPIATGVAPYTTVNQNLIIGYELPFDQANFNIKTFAVSLVGTWQYWNGSWSTLSVADGTSGMTSNGAVTFTPPADWARTSIDGSNSKYFIRFAYISSTTPPVIYTIKGDTWINDGVNTHVRGWNAADPAIINSGELIYNPNAGNSPSTTARAKFKYQSRLATYSYNHPMMKPDNKQMIDGSLTRVQSSYLADQTKQALAQWGWQGMFYDDFDYTIYVSGTGIDISNSDYADSSGCVGATACATAWRTDNTAKDSDMFALVHATYPDVKLGGNTRSNVYGFITGASWALMEPINATIGTGNDNFDMLLSGSNTNGAMCFDDFVTHPTSTSSLLIQDYNFNVDGGNGGLTYGGNLATHVWERGNRGPMIALTKFLIGAPYSGGAINTSFTYNAENAVYPFIDDVWVLNNVNQKPITNDYLATTSKATKTITGDFSLFPSSNLIVRLGGSSCEEDYPATKVNSTTISVTSYATACDHHVGDLIRYAENKKVSDGVSRSWRDVVKWENYFPAMSINFGIPDTAITGTYGAGSRNMTWVTGASKGWPNYPAFGSSYNSNIWRRDYTNSVVFHRPNGGASSYVDYTNSGVNLCINQPDVYPACTGPDYYPLYADGTTGAGTKSINLRRAEGAIMMKAPSGGADISAPTTTATLTGLQTISLSCSDDTACVHTYYCTGIACNPSTLYSSPVSISEGNTLRFYSVDAVPNTENIKNMIVDNTSPIVTGISPSGALSSGTTTTTRSCATHENATCKWSVTSGTSYNSMTTMTTTGGTAHSMADTGLVDGQAYNRYGRCQDAAGNTSNEFQWSYSVASPPPVNPTILYWGGTLNGQGFSVGR